MLGALLALAATATGYVACRGLGLPRWLAPTLGLAGIAVLSSWGVALGVPPMVLTAVVGVTTLAGLTLAGTRLHAWRGPGWPAALLGVAVAAPALLLGVAFAGQAVPVSNHDGAYHVETVDALRRGIPFQTWYPHGFHATVATLLGFVPWVDTARGTLETSQGLAILAPLALFGMARAAGLRPLTAAAGALILSATFVFPYDLHLWGGWPLGTSVLLLLGLWAAALHWVRAPHPIWALLAGLFGGAILLVHGTEVYSGAVGLTVLAVVNLRHLRWRALLRHLPLAASVLLLVAAPYLGTLLGWAGAGGASQAGQSVLDTSATGATPALWSDANDLIPALVGAGSMLDAFPRLFLFVLGVVASRRSPGRQLVALYAVFAALLLAFDVPGLPFISRIYVATYPWADGHRLGQIVTLVASLLLARGAVGVVEGIAALRRALPHRPNLGRRAAVAGALLAGLLLEGGAVSAYKRLSEVAVSQTTFNADDARAMAWLRQHAAPDEMLANDFAADAGLWAPYKANLPILLPRSGSPERGADSERIEMKIDNLNTEPDLAAQACALNLRYVYAGAAHNTYDHPPLDVTALERSPGLEEVFRSGDAAVFRTRLSCA